MPLINLQTDLKSIKYGQDRPGGGDSGLPYIQTDINSLDNPNRTQVGRLITKLRLTKFDDGLVRGGIIGAANASIVDTLRIGKFFLDAPKGPLFIVKQVGLQLSNPRLETPKNPANIALGFPDNVLSVGTNGLLQPTRIYNAGVNTLAQIPVNAFGGHFNRHGILPVQNENSKYEAVVTANNAFILNNSSIINSGYKNVGNRLLRLATKFDLGKQEGKSNINTVLNGVRGFLNRVATTVGINIRGLKPDDLVIDEYKGGPGSIYGIVGSTTINRTLQITNDQSKIDRSLSFSNQFAGKTKDNSGAPVSVNYFNDLGTGKNAIVNYDFGNGGIPFGDTSLVAGVDQNVVKYSLPSVGNPNLKTYSALKKQIEQQQKLLNPDKITPITSGSTSINVPYNQFGIYNVFRGAEGGDLNANNDVFNVGNSYTSTNQTKIGYKNSYGDVITINKSSWYLASRETRVGSGRTDSINLTPLFKTNIGKNYSVVTIGGIKYTVNDLCKFRIEAIDGDDPSKSIFMIFRAYLTDLSDDVSADWNDIKYAGRGEKFYIYSGFSRKINISFKVAALSAKEMEPMYQKLNNLMGNLMPDYTPGNTGGFPGTTSGVMRGPLVRMTIGNWIDSQPGVLNSLSYKVPQDSPWEIALNEPTLGGSKEMVLPHIVEVNLSFTPIGSQTQEINKTPNKASDTQHTSHIAQNYNGTSPGEPNYITGSTIETATFPGGEPSQPY
jgi:hypothetical protein